MRNHGLIVSPLALALIAMTGSAAAAQESTIYNFGAVASPATPNSTVVFDAQGNLYGVAAGGFQANGNIVNGAVAYELSPASEGSWTMKELYQFTVLASGESPNGVIFDDKKVNLYGTTQDGGANNGGTVFELSPNGDGSWTETVLYSFLATDKDGSTPEAELIFDADGNLYGTTNSGGMSGQGTVFELSPGSGSTWTEKILYSFQATGNDGHSPRTAPLVFDKKGNLYGITYAGGNPLGYGTAFELSPGTGGAWTEQVMHTFGIEDTPDAATAASGLTLDADGNLYGTSSAGGDHGSGTVYELSPTGDTWTETVLYSFDGGTTGSTDGESPVGGLVFDAKGDLVGTTFHGGAYNSQGTIFELTPNDGMWTEKVLYSFKDSNLNDGFYPIGTLTPDTSGDFYGVATDGGTDVYGTVFKFQTPLPVAAKPTFTPPAGTYSATQSVRIEDATPGAVIHYTTNGDAPTSGSTEYAGPIAVSSTETIRAVADAAGYAQSPVATAAYVIEPAAATPKIDPVGGAYATAVTVKITDATAGAGIFYTIDGTTPTKSSTKYTAPFKVPDNLTVKAIATGGGHSASKVATAAYTVKTATPKLSLKTGNYAKAQKLKITDATPHAVIYYTTNGTAPTTASTKYTQPVAIAANLTIKAMALAKDYAKSDAVIAAYSIDAATPKISPAGGTFSAATTVKITDATVGAVIYYTTNGTIPSAKSTKYVNAFSVSKSTTVMAIAIAKTNAKSLVATAKFAFK